MGKMRCIVGQVWASFIVYLRCIDSMVVTSIATACLQCTICTMHNAQYTNLRIDSLDRVPSPISLHFVNLSCLCSAVSAACQALCHYHVCRSLFSLSCNSFRALLEVFSISMFTTSSKTTLKSKNSDFASVACLDGIVSIRDMHWTCNVRYIYIITYIYIYIYYMDGYYMSVRLHFTSHRRVKVQHKSAISSHTTVFTHQIIYLLYTTLI